MRNLTNLVVMSVLALVLGASGLAAQQMRFQGRLTGPGPSFTPTTVATSVRFRIYDHPTNTTPVLWEETQTITPAATGVFSTNLGATVPLTGIDFSQTLYLGVRVGTDPEMVPRYMLTSTSSAFYANEAGNSETLDGLDSTAFALLSGANFTGNVSSTGTFSGNGSGLTNVNASTLGGLARTGFAELTGANFTGNVSTTGVFSGSGSGLTNVNASTLGGLARSGFAELTGASFSGVITAPGFNSTGTVSAGTLSATNFVGGNFVGNGSGLTNVNAVTLAGNAPSAFALLGAGSNTFSGTVQATTITATTGFVGNLTGNVTGNVSGTSAGFTGSLSGDVTGTQAATLIANNAVTTAKILDGTILGADLNSAINITTTGNIASRNAALADGDLTWTATAGNAAFLQLPDETESNNLIRTPSAGAVRYNSGTSAVEVWNGTTWVAGNGYFAGSGLSLVGNTFNVSSLGITTAMLANDAVNTGKILDGTITGADLNGAISISTSGSVTAASFSGNGAALTNLTGTNVTGPVANATTAVNFSGTLAGDVTGTQGATVIGAGAVTSIKILDGTITGADLNSAISISTSGSVTAASFIGDGSALTNLTGANVTGTVANATNAVNATTAVNFSGALSGDVTGTQGATLIANGAVNSAKILDGSIVGADLNSGINISTTGAILAATFSGNGGSLTGLNAAAITVGSLNDGQIDNNITLNATTLITGSAGLNITSGGANIAGGLVVSGGSITGNLIGNVTGNVTGNISGTASGFTGSLSGDVTGTQGATVVSFVGGQTAANVASGAQAANNATSTNTSSRIVVRDASGNFAANMITANLTGNVTGNADTATTAGSATTAATASNALLLGGLARAGFAELTGASFTGNVTAPTFNGNLNGNANTATSATSATSFTGGLSGDVTGTQGATLIANGVVTSAKILDGTIAAADLAGNISITTTGNYSGVNATLNDGDLNFTSAGNAAFLQLPSEVVSDDTLRAPAQGAVRFNSTSNVIELWDGSAWVTGNISPLSVTNGMLANDAVTSNKILDGTIVGADLASNIDIFTSGDIQGFNISANAGNFNNLTAGNLIFTSGTITGNFTVLGNTNLFTLTTSGAVTHNSTLNVVGATTLSTLSTSGLATLNSASVTNNLTVGGDIAADDITAAGNLSVLGNSSLNTLGTSGLATLFAVNVTNNASIGGTLNVTGNTGLSTVSTSGAATLNSASITNNATVGGTLGVTGNTSLSTVSTSGAATLNSASITNNATVGGTLGVTGNTSLSTVSTSGAATLDSVGVTNNATVGGTLGVTSLLTASNGLTVSSGTVSLPAGEIGNTELANSSLTVTAGTGLSGGGVVSLGGSITINSTGTLSVTGTTNQIDVTAGQNPTISISSGYLGQTSITTLGTITTGTWNGTSIADANVDNNLTISATGNVDDGALSANVTLQGNTFNGNSELVQLNGTGQLPALDGSALTSLTGANVTGTVANATTAVNFSGSLTGDVTGTQGATVIANDAVTSAKILNGTVVGADLDTGIIISTTGSVTAASFSGDGSALTSLTGANVTGTVANATTAVNFSGSLTGDVTGTQGATVIANDAVTSAKILNGTIGGADLDTGIIISTTGSVTAASFSGDGSALTSLNASNISSGTLSTGVTLNLSNLSYTGSMSGGNISGGTFGAVDGSALTNLNASNVSSGTLTASLVGNGLTDAQVNNNLTISGGVIDNTTIGSTTAASGAFTTLSASNGLGVSGTVNVNTASSGGTNIGNLTNGGPIYVRTGPGNGIEFNLTNGFDVQTGGLITMNSGGSGWSIGPTGNFSTGGSMTAGSFSGNGSSLTSLNASNISSGTLSTGVTLSLSNLSYTGTMSGNNISGGTFGAVNGTNLTNLNASALATGTLPSARLSGSYTSALTFSNVGNAFTGSYTGNGSGLTSLNASNLASGTIPDSVLSGTYTNALTLSNGANSFTGTFVYSPGAPANWAGAPTSVAEAIDRIAAALASGSYVPGTPIP